MCVLITCSLLCPRNIVMSMFLCLSVNSHISRTTWLNFTKFPLHIECGIGSVLLWRFCDMLYTFSFVSCFVYTFSALTLLIGHPACKNWVMWCCLQWFTSLVPDDTDCPGKEAVIREHVVVFRFSIYDFMFSHSMLYGALFPSIESITA